MSSSFTSAIMDNINKYIQLKKKSTHYKQLDDILNIILDIFPLQLLLADKPDSWGKESTIAVTKFFELFDTFHSIFTRYQVPTEMEYTSLSLVQLQFDTYKRVLSELVSDHTTVNKIKSTIVYLCSAPDRHCFIGDNKCIPVLVFHDGILMEEWLPE